MQTVDLRPLKSFAIKNLPNYSVTRYVIISDDDFVNAAEFVARVKIWLSLLQIDFKNGNRRQL